MFPELRQLQARHPEAAEISGNLSYLQKREQQIQYLHFQADGWPIDSGIVESGYKLVVEACLKASGMHWADQHVNSMLTLRNNVCSGRWKEDWPRIEDRLRQRASQQRQKLHQFRRKPVPVRKSASPRTALAPIPKIPLQKPHQPKDPKDNPWRKFKFGRTLYQRDDSPKK